MLELFCEEWLNVDKTENGGTVSHLSVVFFVFVMVLEEYE